METTLITAETDNSVSFTISNLTPENPPSHLLSAAQFFEKMTDLKPKYEDFSHRGSSDQVYLNCQTNPILVALHAAFSGHHHLVLSVSDFIFLIGKGLAQHITLNAEKLRTQFVEHQGQKEIVILRDEFVLGQQNDWATVFDDFSQEIKKMVKSDAYGVIVDDTSVASRSSKIVSEIVLMEAMSKYFSYRVLTRCGIPRVTLKGVPKDWENLKNKVAKLKEMNKDDCLQLGWWLDVLVPVVDQLCESGMTRKINQEFWKNMYKYHEGSGSQTVTGWIAAFIPYVVQSGKGKEHGLEKNLFVKWGKENYEGIENGNIPKSICALPFIWEYIGTEIPMTFYAMPAPKWDHNSKQVSIDYMWSVVYAKKD